MATRPGPAPGARGRLLRHRVRGGAAAPRRAARHPVAHGVRRARARRGAGRRGGAGGAASRPRRAAAERGGGRDGGGRVGGTECSGHVVAAGRVRLRHRTARARPGRAAHVRRRRRDAHHRWSSRLSGPLGARLRRPGQPAGALGVRWMVRAGGHRGRLAGGALGGRAPGRGRDQLGRCAHGRPVRHARRGRPGLRRRLHRARRGRRGRRRYACAGWTAPPTLGVAGGRSVPRTAGQRRAAGRHRRRRRRARRPRRPRPRAPLGRHGCGRRHRRRRAGAAAQVRAHPAITGSVPRPPAGVDRSAAAAVAPGRHRRRDRGDRPRDRRRLGDRPARRCRRRPQPRRAGRAGGARDRPGHRDARRPGRGADPRPVGRPVLRARRHVGATARLRAGRHHRVGRRGHGTGGRPVRRLRPRGLLRDPR